MYSHVESTVPYVGEALMEVEQNGELLFWKGCGIFLIAALLCITRNLLLKGELKTNSPSVKHSVINITLSTAVFCFLDFLSL